MKTAYEVRIFSPIDLPYPMNEDIDFEFFIEAEDMDEVKKKGFKVMQENGHYTNRPFHASLAGEIINTEYDNVYRYHFHDDGWCDWFIETDMPYDLSEKEMREKVIRRCVGEIESALSIIKKELYWDSVK